MLRPATPLAGILFVALVLLVISIISTPLVKGIKIASDGGIDFGVFGYCKGDLCSGIKIGYNTSPKGLKDGDFSLPATARHSLSPLLIFHPVAALFTLISLIFSLTAHLHSPSHSPRYLLTLFIITIATFLLVLLAFVVDILIFIPHLAFGGWLVLGATVLLAVALVISCAMWRALVSRKARKKRIAENDEMNGKNFYKAQSATSPAPIASSAPAPRTNGATGADKLPEFATFDAAQKSKSDVSNDDRIPLHSSSNSNRGTTEGAFTRGPGSDDGSERYGGPPRLGQNLIGRGGRGGGFSGARDEYGNPLPPSNAFGAMPSRRDPSDPRDRYDSPNRGPLPFGGRGGRGGYPMRGGRGGHGGGAPPPGGWRGPPPPQGYGADGRRMAPSMAGAMMGRGGRGGPPPPPLSGYDGYGSSVGRGQPYGRESSPYNGGYSGGPPPGALPLPGPGYMARGPPSPQDSVGYYGYGGRREPSPGMPIESGRSQRQASIPPPLTLPELAEGMLVGQAIEMDATTGSPSPSQAVSPTIGTGGLRAERNHSPGVPGEVRHQSPLRRPSGPMSADSEYSTSQDYIPPRATWNEANRTGSPLNMAQELPNTGYQPQAIELPSSDDPPAIQSPAHARINSGDNYYEDVDPRFVEVEPLNATIQPPPSLIPGYGMAQSTNVPDHAENSQGHLHPSDSINRDQSYEDLHSASRSPAESDHSHYTSVSQRGINPNWRPGPGYAESGGLPSRQRMPPYAQQQQQHAQHQRDMLFQGNDEFELPNSPARLGAGQRGTGRMPGGALPPGGPGNGRYPGPSEL